MSDGNWRLDPPFLAQLAKLVLWMVSDKAPKGRVEMDEYTGTPDVRPAWFAMSDVEVRLPRARRLSHDEWKAAVQPGAPSLPWTDRRGRTIRSFMLVPIPECSSRTTAVFMDAKGDVIDVLNSGPKYRTAAALKPALGELVLLPKPRS
jgi:hypothetical protein